MFPRLARLARDSSDDHRPALPHYLSPVAGRDRQVHPVRHASRQSRRRRHAVSDGLRAAPPRRISFPITDRPGDRARLARSILGVQRWDHHTGHFGLERSGRHRSRDDGLSTLHAADRHHRAARVLCRPITRSRTARRMVRPHHAHLVHHARGSGDQECFPDS